MCGKPVSWVTLDRKKRLKISIVLNHWLVIQNVQFIKVAGREVVFISVPGRHRDGREKRQEINNLPNLWFDLFAKTAFMLMPARHTTGNKSLSPKNAIIILRAVLIADFLIFKFSFPNDK